MPLRSALVISLALCFLNTAAQAAMTQEELNRIVGAFYSSTAVDEGNAYEVSNLTITKDIGTFTLKQGTLYLTKPIEGMIATAVFVGDGTAAIKPVRPMDRKCLDLAADQHLHKTPGGQLNTTFTQMVIVSFDDTLDTLVKSLATKSSSADVHAAAQILKDRIDVMFTLELAFDFETLSKRAGMKGGELYLDFKTEDYQWLEYSYGERDQFEVRLFTLENIGNTIGVRPLLRTHRTADFDSNGNYIADPARDQKDWIDVTGYKLDITIPDTQHFIVEGDVTFKPVSEGLPLVYFDLRNNIPAPGTIARSTEKAKPIYLKKLTDSAGKELPFFHTKHQVYVVPTEPLRAGNEYTFHFSLDEQTIIQLSSVHYEVLNTYPWFPQHGYNGGSYKMDWTIKAKKPLWATGSGKIVEEHADANMNVTHLLFEKDVQFPSLIFGQYQKVTDVYKPSTGGNGVALSAYSWPSAVFYILYTNRELPRGVPLEFEVTVPPNKPKDVLEEAKNIIAFDESLYGSFPFDSLQVAEMAPFLGYGQSPPGFVQLTGEAFMSSQEIANTPFLSGDFFHAFFSHEVSHQWWGHLINWASDEDTWLSESFAEYSAGLYVMQLMGQTRFQGVLKEWRDAAKIADPYGPIAWAENLSGQGGGRHRQFLLYNKGPYVVHMLRMQIGHENFLKAVRNAIAKYASKPVTTDQLRQEFEAVAGYKLDYFFNQWYRNTGIPMFDYTTDVRQGDDGKWLATIKFSQRDKQNYKIVAMPIFFHFGGDKVVVRTPAITKADDVYQVKLPEKPQSITLDDYHTLLADFVAQQGAAGQ